MEMKDDLKGILDLFLRIEYISANAAFTPTMRNDMPRTLVISASWIIWRNLYCEYPREAHGKPVIMYVLIYSRVTQSTGAKKGRGSRNFFVT